jgi:serine/threonine-protein kinase RIO1
VLFSNVLTRVVSSMCLLLITHRSHIKELVAVLFCIATSSETPVLPANLSDAAKVSIHVYVCIYMYTSMHHIQHSYNVRFSSVYQ